MGKVFRGQVVGRPVVRGPVVRGPLVGGSVFGVLAHTQLCVFLTQITHTLDIHLLE